MAAKGQDNEVIQRLLDWAPSRQVLVEMEMRDFASHGSTALFWQQDWMQWNNPMSASPWPQVVFLS